MTKLVSRPLLGICAICAIVGGAALVTMVAVSFGASRYVPEFQIGGYGLLIGGFLAWQATGGSWPATRNDSRRP